ncbi:hypothetical protein [Methylocystis parvus]|uniref:DUF3551 domain-containing protein n=1 Tax=Methylocystis parvus TaxID=134 RepID=A0A6B8M5M3_9HYPH|nr:hypothetical protein [Methylocystis parvus]QGM96633.1 hypothetical protein F7D14_03450 [Methylocystis parvus]WBJ99510.1 hypothetical protein MMG94_16180 [Methylocystis parvus OBBP]
MRPTIVRPPVIRIAAIGVALSLSWVAPALAVNTWAGSTAEEMAEEQDVCAPDAYKFCGGNTIFIFEMENCLKGHMGQLSKPCRAQLSPTNFKKYYQEEWRPFD